MVEADKRSAEAGASAAEDSAAESKNGNRTAAYRQNHPAASHSHKNNPEYRRSRMPVSARRLLAVAALRRACA
jgi:hypothetical protein